MGERKKRIGGTNMKWYAIGKTLTPLDRAPESGAAVVLLNSDELAHETALPGLEAVLHHTPSARDAHVCKAEVRSNCLSGTLALPRGRRDGTRLCCGYLVTKDRVVLVDDGEMAEPYLKHIVKEKRLIENSVGRFLYDFFELLIARDLHRLEEIEDRATALEERVLAGELEEFSTPMSELRKETMAWYRCGKMRTATFRTRSADCSDYLKSASSACARNRSCYVNTARRSSRCSSRKSTSGRIASCRY